MKGRKAQGHLGDSGNAEMALEVLSINLRPHQHPSHSHRAACTPLGSPLTPGPQIRAGTHCPRGRADSRALLPSLVFIVNMEEPHRGSLQNSPRGRLGLGLGSSQQPGLEGRGLRPCHFKKASLSECLSLICSVGSCQLLWATVRVK